MARIFITGSSDGIGLLAAKELISKGHQVVIHARNEERSKEALVKVPGSETVLTANLASLTETKALASEVNKLGKFDVIIHNAGVYQTSAEEIWAVNVIAPYVLTCLINRPSRLIYLSSDMHLHGHAISANLKENLKKVTYSDSKLYVLMLCKIVAARWSQVKANAVNPGWVPTKMGGRGAPDDLQKGYQTQVWLATGNDHAASVSGGYFYHQKEAAYNRQADDLLLQNEFLMACQELTDVSLP